MSNTTSLKAASNAAQHTPGPWGYNKAPQMGYYNIERSDGGIIGRAISEENARLIAASPTMYDYVVKQANAGCKEAQSMLASLNIG